MRNAIISIKFYEFYNQSFSAVKGYSGRGYSSGFVGMGAVPTINFGAMMGCCHCRHFAIEFPLLFNVIPRAGAMGPALQPKLPISAAFLRVMLGYIGESKNLSPPREELP